MNAEAVPVQLLADAVDEKWHIVVDDLDHGMGRLPAILFELRVVDAQLGLARRTVLTEAQLCQSGAVQIEWIALGQILGRHVTEISPDKPLGDRRLIATETITQLSRETVDDLGLTLLGACRHFAPRFSGPIPASNHITAAE